MVDVFVEREYSPPLARDDVLAAAGNAADCFGLYKIDWLESLLSVDGSILLCHFRARDLESVRIALKVIDGRVPPLWPGVEHRGAAAANANVIVERSFDEAVTVAEIQAMEDANIWCLETRKVSFERTFFSRDGKRMICLYQAPDVEAVRQAQRQANMPHQRVWGFERLAPGKIPTAQ